MDCFADCGCDGCHDDACWPKCDTCGHSVGAINECTCDRDGDYDFEEDSIELVRNPVTGQVFQPKYEPELGP